MDNKLYTIEEVVDIIKVTRRTIYKYIKQGDLKAIKVGRLWRVSEESLKEFLSE